MRRFYVWAFVLAGLFRLFCLPVFVIDDDEAWSQAASIAMKSPWQFYRSAVDHKPPGFVWFYWFVNHLVHFASDPRIVRAAFTLLAIVAAWAVGIMATRFASARGMQERRASDRRAIGWCAAALFLLITALPAPKLLAVTADGLIVDFVIFGYAVALCWEVPFAAIVSGALLACALLVKQTAVFFAIPILFSRWPRKWSLKEIPLFLLGAALVLVPCIWGLGVSDFFYWNWTYPKEVLTTVRAQLFESNTEGLETLALYVLAILPLAWILGRSLLRAGKDRIVAGLGDFRFLWLVAGFCGFAIGKGLFLHYLLLIAPPIALLGAQALEGGTDGDGKAADEKPKPLPLKTFAWLGIQYVAGCLILAIPSSGIFWGTDLVYFHALGHVMGASLRPGEKAMVWGGSALPLAYARVSHPTRFVLPRFAVAPYATELTRRYFHSELEQDPPELILDLHERGDNQFDNPIESEPFVAQMVRSRYKLYVSESIPWAKFYFLHPPADAAGLLPVTDARRALELYEPFPNRRESWLQLRAVARGGDLGLTVDADWILRAKAALALLERQSSNDATKQQAQSLIDLLARQLQSDTALPDDIRSQVLTFLSAEATRNDGVRALPILSFSWWATVAMVELQPRAPLPQTK